MNDINPDIEPEPEGTPDSSEESTPTDRPLGFWLRAVDALISREFDSAFADEGLTRRDWMLLNVLARSAESSEFAERLARKGGKHLRGFERRGWAEEAGDGTWTLTDEGRAARDRLSTLVDGIRSRVAGAVSPEDFATTLASLEAIARELGWDENARMPRFGRGRGFGPGWAFRSGFGPGFQPGFGRDFIPGGGPGFGHGFRPGFGGPGPDFDPRQGFGPWHDFHHGHGFGPEFGHSHGFGPEFGHGFGHGPARPDTEANGDPEFEHGHGYGRGWEHGRRHGHGWEHGHAGHRGYGERQHGHHGHHGGEHRDQPASSESAYERGFDAGYARGAAERDA